MERHHRRPAGRQVRRDRQPGRHHRQAQGNARLLAGLYVFVRAADPAQGRHASVQVARRPEGQEARRRARHELHGHGEVGAGHRREDVSGRARVSARPRGRPSRRGTQRPPDALAYLTKNSQLPLRPGANVGSANPSGIPFKKGNPKFQKAIDDAMTQLEADGTFTKISDKWFGIDVTKPLK
ncbi:transporter substrate-binding domain-containing protein [Burkholderia multivorans]|uniref:transporter substrate-binding domain-containing protein n=1 Tax=Burkholderia multivorans TaxID=87883 RepID=UPI0035BE2A68